MSITWEKGDEKTPSQESEDSMSQALADLGMLEQGMTLQDKRDLLNVVRLSKRSAEAEEEERKQKVWPPLPSPRVDHSVDQVLPTRENECLRQEISDEKSDENYVSSSVSLSVINSKVHSSHSEENSIPSTSGEYFGSRHSPVSGETNIKYKSALMNSPKPQLNEISETNFKLKPGLMNSPKPQTIAINETHEMDEAGDRIVVQNGCDNTENVSQQDPLALDNESELEILPSTVKLKQKDMNCLKRKKEERERNIDVFSHSSSANDHNFVRRNFKKNQDRVPFYFVPEGKSLRNYVAYFKCYVNQYYKKLAVIQKNNIEHLEWGAPITLEMSSSFTNFRSGSTDANGDNSSKRYNFRDRCPKPKLVDFTSENSEDAEEEESNDEDIFVFRRKKLPGIKLSAKRKNTSANEAMSTKKEKKDSSLKKLQGGDCLEEAEGGGGEGLVQVQEGEEEVQGENQSSDNNDIFIKSRVATPSRKRTRKPRTKLLQSQNEISDDINDIVPNVAIASIIEPDIVIAEGPAIESTSSGPSTSTGPFTSSHKEILDNWGKNWSIGSVKQRRLQLDSKNGRVNRRKSEPRKNPDVVIVDDEIREVSCEPRSDVPCPICGQYFSASDIEEHASECNQYSPDNTCSSAKV